MEDGLRPPKQYSERRWTATRSSFEHEPDDDSTRAPSQDVERAEPDQARSGTAIAVSSLSMTSACSRGHTAISSPPHRELCLQTTVQNVATARSLQHDLDFAESAVRRMLINFGEV